MNIITIHDQSPLGPDILDQDAVFFMFPRDAVERGRVSDTIGQLNALSNTPDLVRKFQGRVAFAFSGYDSDPRHIYQVPEARAFFAKICEAWPLWAHFLAREPDMMAVAYLLLCESEPFYENKIRVSVSVDTNAANELTRSWLAAATGLHALHGISEEESLGYIKGFLENLPL